MDNIITAEYKYVYDPTHQHKPQGDRWHRTGSGWSFNTGNDSVSHHNVPEYNHVPLKKHPVKEDEQADLFQDKSDGFDTDDAIVMQEQEKGNDENIENDADNKEDSENIEEDELETNDIEDDKDIEEVEQVQQEEQKDIENEKEQDEIDSDIVDQDNVDDEQGTEIELNDQEEDQVNYFSDQKKEDYLNQNNFDDYINKMNDFINQFDEGQGKQNEVTFKAVASNLDWSKQQDVQAFANHCKEKGIDNSQQIIAFLYYQNNNDKDKFEQIIDKMN